MVTDDSTGAPTFRRLSPDSDHKKHGSVNITDKPVDLEEFTKLAISSHRRLVRCDDPAAGLQGLLDPATGERFVISEREIQKRSL